MNAQAIQRYRAIAILMESFAKEGKPEQAATIQREVAACGETVETAHLVARFNCQDPCSVQLLRKLP